jgi:predicted kinase
VEGIKMPKCYQLIGVPCAGKSTWIKNQEWAKDCVIVSTDAWVEREAERVGKTYSEIFDEYMPKAVELMANQVENAREKNLDIIWDQTSVSVKSRKRKFNMLRDYEHIAVVFTTPEKDELARRLASRPGKNIPDHVMRSMIDNFDMPTLDEGFAEIRVV